MTEADLRVHLGKQTTKSVGLIDVTDLERSFEESAAALQKLITGGHKVVLFDGLNATHLSRVGALIDGLAGSNPLFSVGSSGVGTALTSFWGASTQSLPVAARAGSPLLALSGSCSPVTGGQIAWARANGFDGFALSLDCSDSSAALGPIVDALRAGRNVVAYTSLGQAKAHVPAERLGTMLGQLAREAVASAGLKRIVVAGGDTSSYAGRALGIESLEMLAPLTPGAPLCRARAPDSPADGLEIVFKGGQVGAPDFFAQAGGHS
jgi:uncharacterized protein YgbK (DUF1537 family)